MIVEIVLMLNTRILPTFFTQHSLTLLKVFIGNVPYTTENRYTTVWSNTLLYTAPQRVEQNLFRRWTHKRHPIHRPYGWAMGCRLWGLGWKLSACKQHCTVFVAQIVWQWIRSETDVYTMLGYIQSLTGIIICCNHHQQTRYNKVSWGHRLTITWSCFQ